MNTRQKLISLAGTMIVVTLLAGAAAAAVVSACGLGAWPLQAYLCALGGAALCALFAFSPRIAIPAAVAAVTGTGAYIALNISGGSISSLIEGISAISGGADITALSGSAALIAGALGAIISLFVHALISDRGTFSTVLAVAVCLGTSVISAAASGQVDIWQLAPAALGACLAFSNTVEQRRNGGHIKALIPAALAVALAMLMLPAQGTTFAPLEKAAEWVRSVYEEYFSYTQERVAFSISEEGYDYYGMRGDEPTHMLGGPANPDAEAVMQVKTENDLLLRGTARGTYTGYSWEDNSARSRNLYYDFTRRSRRNSIFGTTLMENLEGAETAFEPVSADVTMLADGSSTLFVPARLTDFDMNLRNAVYYNSVGEMFLARNVERGDEYSFTAMEPISAAAVTGLAATIDTSDDGYADALRDYTALPGGIDDGVYQIAAAFTEGAQTDAEMAQAIMEGLRVNCAYSIDVDYPPQDRDFVSYFLLESKEGYCSYFASAMAVLCRAEGIPARYVEGYRVYAESDGVTNVTGEDAHAWVEVYIRGMGWVAYDPTPGENDHAEPQQSDNGGHEPDASPTPSPTPEPTPTPEPLPPDATPTPEPQTGESTPTPSPQPSENPAAGPQDDANDSPPEDDEKSRKWLWIALIVVIVLIIIALVAWLFKKRLEATDPIRLIAKAKNDNRAVLILYRSMLTLLAQLGQAPLSGETPEAFAQRVSTSGLSNPDFVEFARGVVHSRYSRTSAGRELTSLGARAYMRFRQHMKRSERIRFDIHRALHGLGSFDVIP